MQQKHENKILYIIFFKLTTEFRTSLEYANTSDTSLEGQAYLRLHPEMWQYLESQSNANPVKQAEAAPPSSLDVSDMIPRYPAASADSDGVAVGGQYMPAYPGAYDLQSQPELSPAVKYPSRHNVHKHTQYPSSGSLGLESEVGTSNGNSLDINVDRRTPEEELWPGNYYQAQGGNGRGRFRYLPNEDAARDNGNSNGNEDFGQPQQPRWKRHIGPHDMDGIQRLISTGIILKHK